MSKSSEKRKESTSGRAGPRAATAAKSSGTLPQEAKQTKKQIAIGRKQARQNRIIWLCVAGLVLLIALVVAVGVGNELLLKPTAPVARVNGAKIRTDDFQNLLRYRRYNSHLTIQNLQNELDSIDTTQQGNEFLVNFYDSQLQQLQTSLLTAPETTLDELIEDALIQQKAGESGISVTDQDATQRIDEDVRRAASPPAQQPVSGTLEISTPTPVPQEKLDEIYQNAITNMGLSDKQFRAIVKRSLYRTKVEELLASQVLTTGLVIHMHLVEAGSDDQAQASLQRVQAGEEFALVARDISTDTLTTEQGGDLGWVTTGQLTSRYGQEVEDTAFGLDVGQAATVQSGDKLYLIQVSERNENGSLPEEVVATRKSSALGDWLVERKASLEVKIERLLTPERIPPDPQGSSTTQ